MIGHDDENEEVHYKVADKRKFNSDGSLRAGVTLEPAKPVERPATQASEIRPAEAVDPTSGAGQAIDEEP